MPLIAEVLVALFEPFDLLIETAVVEDQLLMLSGDLAQMLPVLLLLHSR